MWYSVVSLTWKQRLDLGKLHHPQVAPFCGIHSEMCHAKRHMVQDAEAQAFTQMYGSLKINMRSGNCFSIVSTKVVHIVLQLNNEAFLCLYCTSDKSDYHFFF